MAAVTAAVGPELEAAVAAAGRGRVDGALLDAADARAAAAEREAGRLRREVELLGEQLADAQAQARRGGHEGRVLNACPDRVPLLLYLQPYFCCSLHAFPFHPSILSPLLCSSSA